MKRAVCCVFVGLSGAVGGLISIALAQGGLRFRHLGLVAALGPLKSARVHLCAANRN